MPSRRELLVAAVAAPATAGCLGDDPETASDGDESTAAGDADDAGSDGGDDETDADTGSDAGDPDARLVTTTASAESDETNDPEEVVLATYGDVDHVGAVEYDDRTGTHYVPIAFTDEGTATFVDRLAEVGGLAEPREQELRVHVDGEVIGTYGLSPSLAEAMDAGEWEGNFRILSDDESQLEAFRAEFE